MNQPLINGEAYSWSQISLVLLGTPVVGITNVSYTEEQEMEENYGAGNRPVSRGYGKITTEGSITLYMTEVEALQDAVSSGRLQDIPEFDIVVSYIPNDSNRTKTHILRNCRFKNNGREIDQGATNITTELSLMISHIDWKG